MSAHHAIHCDWCGSTSEVAPIARRLHLMRKALKREGWRVSLPSGEDFCVDCVADGFHKTEVRRRSNERVAK